MPNANHSQSNHALPSARALLAALCILTAPALLAADGDDDRAEEVADGVTTEFIERLQERLQANGQDIGVRSVRPSPAPGIYEVELEIGYLYATGDGRYLLGGPLYEVRKDGPVDLTEEAFSSKRLALMASIADGDAIAFAPPDGARKSVFVFTDTDCGFCRQMHDYMPEYNALGIEVRYLAYPRAGVGSTTYDDMVSAWCADDPHAAMTTLKRGEGVPAKTCANPVAAQYQLGRQVGVNGTPNMVLPDGSLVTGFMMPDQLAEKLGI